MAQSIYELLDSLSTETSVPAVKDKDGNILRKDQGLVEHTIPRKLLPTSAEFEDENALLNWAKENGVLHQALQTGIQGRIIELRAIFKSMKKGEVWTADNGQAKVNSSEWKVVHRPKVGGQSNEEIKNQAIFEANLKMAKAMKGTPGVTTEMIITIISANCKPDMVNSIMEAIQ